MKLSIFGATGRMGRAVTRLAHQAPDISIVGAACARSDAGFGRDVGELAGVGTVGVATTDDVNAALLGAEVLIDFSSASATVGLLRAAVRHGVAVVSGTTNLGAEADRELNQAANAIAVLWAPNMSLGIQVLAEVVMQAVRRLGPGYDAEIVEVHHRKKVDAPSGTAVRLAEAIKSVREQSREVYGRKGEVGARDSDELGVFALRGGDVIGDHTVYLFGPSERLEFTHRATSRDLFAHGALNAARFCLGKEPGRYTIADVLSG